MLTYALVLVLVSVLGLEIPTLALPRINYLGFQIRGPSPLRSRIDCQDVAEIVFVGIFPCPRDSNFVASKNISECDLLAEAAAYLAVERVNQDPDILPNITLRLHPIYVSTDEDGGLREILSEYLKTVRTLNQVWGVIGLSGSLKESLPINIQLSFAAYSGVITASFSFRDTRFDYTTPTFYRTLPSFVSTNFGRLVLIDEHDWFRIAILGFADDILYSDERDNFVMMFHGGVEGGLFGHTDIALNEIITDSPEASLNNIKSRNINIIMGFFGPENARDTLCLAYSIGLVSHDHAWVLPSYYDPNWWKKSTRSRYDCTDAEMRNILESVIFIDGIKLPPVDLSLGEFHSQLLSKAVKLFPSSSLIEEDLKPYLLRSRATSAYDAVTLLARNVGVAFRQGGKTCTDIYFQQVVLEEIFMECEYCRIFSDCFLNTRESLQCQKLCGSDFDKPALSPDSVRNITQSSNDLRSYHVLNQLGQVLYSQFLDGEECPIKLWWPIFDHERFSNTSLSIKELDEPTNCVAKRLNISRGDFVRKGSQCSADFIWRGSRVAPSSHFMQVSSVPLGWLVSIALLVLLGEAIAVVLLVLNIAMRKIKNVKASSPWLNVILILGTMIRFPSPLYLSLVISANGYSILKGRDLVPICYCFVWGYYVGGAIYISTLLMKNWRIYRIFQNRQLRSRGNTLTDGVLIAESMIMIIPVVVILIVLSGTSSLRFTSVVTQSRTLQITSITLCSTGMHYVGNESIYHGVISGYLFIPVILLFILVLLNAKIPLSAFHREFVATYRAVFLVTIPSALIILVQIALSTLNPTLLTTYALLGLETFLTLLLIVVLLIILVPAIYSGVREKFEEKKGLHEEREKRKLEVYRADLKHKAETLRFKLKQLNMDINSSKDYQQLASNSTRHDDKRRETKEEDENNRTDSDRT